MNNRTLLNIKEDVQESLINKSPVVALETTIISHGMPYPTNLETALEVERIIRKNGAVPATIGIVNGKIKIGLSQKEIELFAKGNEEINKVSRRDIPFILSKQKNGATTVAGTMLLAELAGIDIMATGGIGGVHRNAGESFDISADLQELSKSNVSVVCSGPKSILDIPLTIEYLETMGIPIIGYKTKILPTFFCRESNFDVDYTFETAEEIAKSILLKKKIKIKGSNLICNPISEKYSIPAKKVDFAINESLKIANKNNIKGKELTPFLLTQVLKITKGKSLDSNIQLMLNNALLASEISKELSKISL